MGACCTQANIPGSNSEIDNSVSIDELIDIINYKKLQLPSERKFLSENISNPNFTLPPDIQISAPLSPSDKRKRIAHLENLERCFGNVLDLLNSSKSFLPLKETKNHVSSIFSHYFKLYDENKTYNISFDKFRTFVDKYQTNI